MPRLGTARSSFAIGLTAGVLGTLGSVAWVGSPGAAFAQTNDDAPAAPDARPDKPEPTRQLSRAQAMGMTLAHQIEQTEGCLGVELAMTQNTQMMTVMAWFENKAAAVRWYYSPAHQMMMRSIGDDASKHTPLEHVEDEDAPVMVWASLKFAGPDEEPRVAGPMRLNAIAIEMYTPLPGGAAVGERVTPRSLEIDGFDWIGE